MNKSEHRAVLKAAITEMSDQVKRSASEAVCRRLHSIASVNMAETVFAYLPLPDEVDLRPLLAMWLNEERVVGVPLVSWKEATMHVGRLTGLSEQSLVSTRHGLQEPNHHRLIPADTIDVVLVPGLGFDASGGRLGRGGGFYDRFLAISRPPIVIGIAFDEQITDAIPSEEHDQRMTAVVTPSRLLL